MSMSKLYDSDDLDFMPEVEAATRRRGHRFAYMLTIMSVVFVACFLVWAHYAVLDEVTRGEATIIPSSKTQVIQNLEGGILAEILVRGRQHRRDRRHPGAESTTPRRRPASATPARAT